MTDAPTGTKRLSRAEFETLERNASSLDYRRLAAWARQADDALREAWEDIHSDCPTPDAGGCSDLCRRLNAARLDAPRHEPEEKP